MNKSKNTLQRRLILDTVKAFKIHPTVEDVFTEIHKKYPSITKATVYRNLRCLAKSDDIGQVLIGSDIERYDNRTDRHYHFKCDACGKICDVDIDYIKDINERVRQQYGFQIYQHDLVFRGHCRQCQSKSRKNSFNADKSDK